MPWTATNMGRDYYNRLMKAQNKDMPATNMGKDYYNRVSQLYPKPFQKQTVPTAPKPTAPATPKQVYTQPKATPPLQNIQPQKNPYEDFYNDLARRLEEAREAEQRARAAAIERAVSQLQGNIPLINQTANDAKSDVYANARVSAIGNNDILASQGLAGNLYDDPRSGYSESARISQDVAMRGNLSNLEKERANQLTNLQNQIANVRSTGEIDSAQINSDYSNKFLQLQMQIAQQAEDRKRYENSLALQEAGLTGMYNGNPTLELQRYRNSLNSASSGVSSSGSDSSDSTNTDGELSYTDFQAIMNTSDPLGTAEKYAIDSGMSLSQYNSIVNNIKEYQNAQKASILELVLFDLKVTSNPSAYIHQRKSELMRDGIYDEVLQAYKKLTGSDFDEREKLLPEYLY